MTEFISAKLLLKNKECGQDLAEYALLIGLMAVIVVLAVTLLGTEISTLFSTLGSYRQLERFEFERPVPESHQQ